MVILVIKMQWNFGLLIKIKKFTEMHAKSHWNLNGSRNYDRIIRKTKIKKHMVLKIAI